MDKLKGDIELVDSVMIDGGVWSNKREAWTRLKTVLNQTDNRENYCCQGTDHKCPLNANNGFCAAEKCQYQVQQREDRT